MLGIRKTLGILALSTSLALPLAASAQATPAQPPATHARSRHHARTGHHVASHPRNQGQQHRQSSNPTPAQR